MGWREYVFSSLSTCSAKSRGVTFLTLNHKVRKKKKEKKQRVVHSSQRNHHWSRLHHLIFLSGFTWDCYSSVCTTHCNDPDCNNPQLQPTSWVEMDSWTVIVYERANRYDPYCWIATIRIVIIHNLLVWLP